MKFLSTLWKLLDILGYFWQIVTGTKTAVWQQKLRSKPIIHWFYQLKAHWLHKGRQLCILESIQIGEKRRRAVLQSQSSRNSVSQVDWCKWWIYRHRRLRFLPVKLKIEVKVNRKRERFTDSDIYMNMWTSFWRSLHPWIEQFYQKISIEATLKKQNLHQPGNCWKLAPEI